MKYIMILLLLAPSTVWAKTLKIAILDTGITKSAARSLPLCKKGHRDFTGEGLDDINGHGTNIAGLIKKHAGKADYCLVIMKIFGTRSNPILNSMKALFAVKLLKVDMINYSAGGYGYSKIESNIVKDLLDSGVIINAAAGNEGKGLNKACNYYPACYDKRINVIGNTARTSNYGKIVDEIINGNKQYALGYTLSGSSQSTAIKTGRLIRGE